MNCYLCGNQLEIKVSWRDLFFRDKEETICHACRSSFEHIENGCRICGAPGDILCEDCTYWETTEYSGVIDSGTCLYVYNAAMKEYFHQFKFLQDAVLAEVFSAELADVLKKTKARVVPIPMNAEKLKIRTFAQVDLMLDSAGVDYLHLLRKNGEIQGEKTRAERIGTKNLFTLNGSSVPKKIVLVDDMYTTGATLRLAAKLLKEAGAEEITIVALIRA